MNIDFWSDIVCPYCGLMQHRLNAAVERAPFGAQVSVRHRSFQLHPDLPREGITQRELVVRAGIPQSQIPRLLGTIETAAEAEGLTPYQAIDRTLGPTDHAHELLAYADDQGRGSETWEAMFRAHFGQARKLWTAAEVTRFAGELGFDEQEVAAVLSDRRYRDRVDADQREAQRLGAVGTPFVVIDGRYAIPGSVGADDLLRTLTKVWEENHSQPAPLPVLTEDGPACTPDRCA